MGRVRQPKGGLVIALALLPDGGQHLKLDPVLRSPGCPLHTDEIVEVAHLDDHTTAVVEPRRVCRELVEALYAGGQAKNVQRAECRRECEVLAGGQNCRVQLEPLAKSRIIRMYDSPMARITIRAKGQLTLPDEIRKAARLEEGDLLEAEITADGILLRPQKVIDATQAWFWTPEWQAGEREADVDRGAGRIESFSSGDEFLGALQSQVNARRRRSSR